MLPLHVFAEESLVKNSMNESDAEVAAEGKNTNNIDNSDLYVEVIQQNADARTIVYTGKLI